MMRAAKLLKLIEEAKAKWPKAKFQPYENDKDDAEKGLSIFIPGDTTTEGDYVGRIDFKSKSLESE